MRTVSFDKEALHIAIHILHPDLELTSPVYFSTDATYCVSPSQQIDTGTIMEAIFGMDSMQKDFKGVLLYKLQRRHTTKTGNHPNNDTVKANLHLLVAWDIENYDYRFCVRLIEYTDNFIWDEDKLLALYRKYNDMFYIDYKSNIVTWLMHDGTIMETKRNVTYGLEYKLDIIIHEGTRQYSMRRPMELRLKRLVLPLLMLIVLIYALSLPVQPSVKLDIHNQCLNVDLVSPIYTTYGRLECHRPPDYKVCAGNTIRSSFIINEPGNGSGGILIYKLQRKQTNESTEISKDTSSAIHLLVVWEISGSKMLYAGVLLVEYDKRFDWNKNDLKYLHRKSFGRLRQFPDSATETWSLDDNMTLMITFEIMNEGQLLNVTISEVKRNSYVETPVHIDLER
jgi:hypothetical protein